MTDVLVRLLLALALLTPGCCLPPETPACIWCAKPWHPFAETGLHVDISEGDDDDDD